MATAVSVTRTDNPEIDGLLGGSRWTGTVTYSFPDSPSDYPTNYFGNNEPTTTDFSPAPAAMQVAVNYAMAQVASYTNITVRFAGTGGADIAIAQSPAANPTSYAYYPANVPAGGDVWFGKAYNYSQALLGNYYFATALHELGHALGLKHSQETGGVANVAVPAAHDNSEYTVMSYRSYAGAPLTGYTAEAYGFSQSYMANDILALQTLYGANYTTTHSENTIYTWSPTTGQHFINGVAQLAPGTGTGGSSNRIFETVWDGNGVDTYDFSNYTTALTVNLNPGASSITSATQIVYLGNGHYAAGNIYNAYLFNGDARSYIENAVGGSGNDTITGNLVANNLDGGSGNDTLIGGGGDDTFVGGNGTDTIVFTGNRSSYLISYNAGSQIFMVADQRSGLPDGTDTIAGVENFLFADGAFASSTVIEDSNNVLVGTSDSDTLNGFGGNDILTGGGGNDRIDGGADIDTAVFSGNRADYQMAYDSTAQTFMVLDLRQGSPDGTDSVMLVEQVQFADGLSSYSFDAGGALFSETYNSSNGTHWTNAFDTVGNQTWVWSIGTYDANGVLKSESGLNHDGTYFLSLYDVDNQYTWANATIIFDANWNMMSVSGTADNGSHSVTANDIAVAYDLALWCATPTIDIISSPSPMSVGLGDSAAYSNDIAYATLFLKNVNESFVFSAPGPTPNAMVDLHGCAAANIGDIVMSIVDHLETLPTDFIESYGVNAEGVLHFDAATVADLYGAHGFKFAADHFLI